jgi:hypothetical protein
MELTGERARGQICPFADPVIPVMPFDRLIWNVIGNVIGNVIWNVIWNVINHSFYMNK